MITVRLATLTDTISITEIHKSQTLHPGGPRYDEMTLYDRWQLGGPWMSVETCAVHLNRLLAGSGVPLVAELDGEPLAEAEIYESFEPAPYGHHLHLGMIMTHADFLGRGLGSALMKYVIEMGRLMKCERITATHNDGRDFYAKHGFRLTRTGHRVRVPAQSGRAFYQAVNLTDSNPEQIKGWHMPLGRYQSSRQEWEQLFPYSWAAGVPEILDIPTAHISLSVTGQNAILFTRGSTQPGEIQLSCWSARPLSNPMVTAIRDRANRDGFHTIVTFVMDSELSMLGSDVQQTDYSQDLYELAL